MSAHDPLTRTTKRPEGRSVGAARGRDLSRFLHGRSLFEGGIVGRVRQDETSVFRLPDDFIPGLFRVGLELVEDADALLMVCTLKRPVGDGSYRTAVQSVTSARCSADIPRRRRSGLSDVSPANGAFLGVAIDTYTHLMPVDEVTADVLEGLLA